MTGLPQLYGDLSAWWQLLSAPSDYAEEAAVYAGILAPRGGVSEVLELGSGGGNNASHLKACFAMTLVDISPGMLDVSRALNPECEHIEADMRTVRLGRCFDAVFVHDAIGYMTTRAELEAVAETARAHSRSGGVTLFVPDFVSESFRPGTSHGGHDGDHRSLGYLEWVWDPDPDDDVCCIDMAYLLREGEEVDVVHDRHILGLFPKSVWIEVLSDAGFDPLFETVALSDGESLYLFIGIAAADR